MGTKWTIAHLSVRSNSKIERDLRLTGYCVTKTLFGVSSWDSTEIWWRWRCFWLSSNPLSPMRGGQRPNIDKGRPHVDLKQRIKHFLKKGQCCEYHKKLLWGRSTRPDRLWQWEELSRADKDLKLCSPHWASTSAQWPLSNANMHRKFSQLELHRTLHGVIIEQVLYLLGEPSWWLFLCKY